MLLAAATAPGYAQTTLGSDTFDGGAGDLFQTRIFSPDNTANNGNFPSNDFDQFGIIDPTGPDVPFDFLDDSISFPNDTFGILKSGDRDKFFGMQDTFNNDNNDDVRIDWTFDVSGYENISVAVDMAALGDFEASDELNFFAQIDDGTFQNPLSGAGDSGTFYEITLENGVTTNKYSSPFFDQAEYDFLISNGPGTFTNADGETREITFSTVDNGQDGDLVAQDGLLVEEVFGDPNNEEQVYRVTNPFGTFNNIANEAYKDPIVVTTAEGSTTLNNDLQTIEFDIEETGDILTLTFFASFNGGPEVFVMDDLLITGDLIDMGNLLAGDYNGNGVVDAADYTVWQDSFGDMVAEGTAADGNGDGIINAADYTVWQDNFGNELSSSAFAATFPVPEPTTGLILAGLGLIAARRRRQA